MSIFWIACYRCKRMKYLYKYPQKEYPYIDLVTTNRSRTRNEPEYELVDTGIFDDDRYFDIFVEYAKESPEEILVEITIFNRGKEAATVHALPPFGLEIHGLTEKRRNLS